MIAIFAALLLQAVPAAPAAPAPVDTAATKRPAPPKPPALKPLDAGAAVALFKALCWTNFRAPDDLRAALPLAAIALAEVPHEGAGPTQTWRADAALLTYTAADDLPAGVPSRQCMLRTRLAGAADQLTLAARVADALAVRGGTTRTGTAGAQTSWDVPQPDGRVARLIVSTANAAGGQTDLRQLVLLLAPR